MANKIDKVKIGANNLELIFLNCTIPALKPKSPNSWNMPVKTVIIATIPNSSGLSNLAISAPITIVIAKSEYLVKATTLEDFNI